MVTLAKTAGTYGAEDFAFRLAGRSIAGYWVTGIATAVDGLCTNL